MLQDASAGLCVRKASVQPASHSFTHITFTVKTHIARPHLCIILIVSDYGSTVNFCSPSLTQRKLV